MFWVHDAGDDQVPELIAASFQDYLADIVRMVTEDDA